MDAVQGAAGRTRPVAELSLTVGDCGLFHEARKGTGFMPDPFWFLRAPYSLCTFGMFLFFLAGFYMYTGKAYLRFRGWVYREEQPKRYWLEVAMYCLVGLGFIALFFYKARLLSS